MLPGQRVPPSNLLPNQNHVKVDSYIDGRFFRFTLVIGMWAETCVRANLWLQFLRGEYFPSTSSQSSSQTVFLVAPENGSAASTFPLLWGPGPRGPRSLQCRTNWTPIWASCRLDLLSPYPLRSWVSKLMVIWAQQRFSGKISISDSAHSSWFPFWLSFSLSGLFSVFASSSLHSVKIFLILSTLFFSWRFGRGIQSPTELDVRWLSLFFCFSPWFWAF